MTLLRESQHRKQNHSETWHLTFSLEFFLKCEGVSVSFLGKSPHGRLPLEALILAFEALPT